MMQDAARRTARAAAMSALGLISLCVGVGFLTSALWMVLAAWQDALFAAQVLGMGFVAVGLILFALARVGGRRHRQHTRAQSDAARKPGDPDPVLRLIEGFLMGLEAGRQTSRPRRH